MFKRWLTEIEERAEDSFRGWRWILCQPLLMFPVKWQNDSHRIPLLIPDFFCSSFLSTTQSQKGVVSVRMYAVSIAISDPGNIIARRLACQGCARNWHFLWMCLRKNTFASKKGHVKVKMLKSFLLDFVSSFSHAVRDRLCFVCVVHLVWSRYGTECLFTVTGRKTPNDLLTCFLCCKMQPHLI